MPRQIYSSHIQPHPIKHVYNFVTIPYHFLFLWFLLSVVLYSLHHVLHSAVSNVHVIVDSPSSSSWKAQSKIGSLDIIISIFSHPFLCHAQRKEFTNKNKISTIFLLSLSLSLFSPPRHYFISLFFLLLIIYLFPSFFALATRKTQAYSRHEHSQRKRLSLLLNTSGTFTRDFYFYIFLFFPDFFSLISFHYISKQHPLTAAAPAHVFWFHE